MATTPTGLRRTGHRRRRRPSPGRTPAPRPAPAPGDGSLPAARGIPMLPVPHCTTRSRVGLASLMCSAAPRWFRRGNGVTVQENAISRRRLTRPMDIADFRAELTRGSTRTTTSSRRAYLPAGNARRPHRADAAGEVDPVRRGLDALRLARARRRARRLADAAHRARRRARGPRPHRSRACSRSSRCSRRRSSTSRRPSSPPRSSRACSRAPRCGARGSRSRAPAATSRRCAAARCPTATRARRRAG